MKYIPIILIFLLSCNGNKKEDANAVGEANTRSLSKNKSADTLPQEDTVGCAETEALHTLKPVQKAPMPSPITIGCAVSPPAPVEPLPPVPLPPPKTESCFDPNLKIQDAIQLINDGSEDTQWYIVENKKISYLKDTLATTDTILMKNELQQLGWQLTDSVATSMGNQRKISIQLKKENRMCNIEKKLFLSGNREDNNLQEWFEIRKVK